MSEVSRSKVVGHPNNSVRAKMNNPFVPGEWYRFFGSLTPKTFVFQVKSVKMRKDSLEIDYYHCFHDEEIFSDYPLGYWGEPVEKLPREEINKIKLELL